MGEYLVLARKYRSETFGEVIGQEHIAQTLISAIESGRVAHAYLFTGTRGVGKTTMARILAKALNCLSADTPTTSPCKRCDACRAIARGDDIDVVEIDGASNRGIDEIRQLRANVILRPARSRYKVYYIDEVHMLTKEAFNALLKTLEEPPEHVKFIFSTTEVEKVPPTILSRCQRFDFRNIPTRKIAAHLQAVCESEKVSADADALFSIARAAAGSMRDGLSLLDQLLAGGEKITRDDVLRILGTPAEERTLAIAGAIAEGSAAGALKELAAVLDSGVTLASAVGALGEVFRNMMVMAVCGADSDLVELSDSQRQATAELAERFALPALVQSVGIIAALARNIRTSSVARALAEAVLVRLAEADKFVDPASLAERLEALRSGHLPAGPAPSVARSSRSAEASPAAPPAPTAGAPATAQGQVSEQIQWQESWLATNWHRVMQALSGARQMQVVGLLRLAKVLGFDGRQLTLAFDAGHERLRQRCAGQFDGAIVSALSALAGREIRCRYQSAGGAPPQNASAFGELSTAEKNAIGKDPSVRQVMDLFGGEVIDIRKDTTASDPDGDVERQD